jgi:tryptophan-rich sensory protein
MLLMVLGANLTLNVLWTLAYFGGRQVALALLILVGILATGVWALVLALHVLPQHWIAWLLAPYLVWLCFAALLNVASLGKSCN